MMVMMMMKIIIALTQLFLKLGDPNFAWYYIQMLPTDDDDNDDDDNDNDNDDDDDYCYKVRTSIF